MAANTDCGDAVLWQAAAAGEKAAFGQLFDRHSGAVYNYIYRRTADWSAAEDLTAAVFLQAWRRRGDVVFARDSALPWLLGVARLQLRNAARSRTRYLAALSRAGRDGLAEEGFGDPADLVVRRLDDAQQIRELRAAIARLPRQQREVIELCVYAGLDQQAAALSLGVSAGTVKSRLHRARHRLANELRAAPSGPARAAGRTYEPDR